MEGPIFDLINPFIPNTTDEPLPECPEDILFSSLTILDPLYAHDMHGEPGAAVVYNSKRFGQLHLKLCDPEDESDRGLFAHYVWNASLLLAECIGQGFWLEGLGREKGVEDKEKEEVRRRTEKGEEWGGKRLRREDWKVEAERVLELGAGSGLASMVAALSNAAKVVVTDYPSSVLLSILRLNATSCVARPVAETSSTSKSTCANSISTPPGVDISVEAHEWGVLSTPFALSNAHSFTRVIATDTLWMPYKHAELAASMAHFLKKGLESRVWVAAGFHTGREKLGRFFPEAEKVGLVVQRMWEVDVEGWERGWADDRGEGFGDAKRWTVVAVLGWRDEDESVDKVGD